MRLVWLLLCSVPLAAQPVPLSLKRAVQLAVAPEGNTRVKLTAEALKQAESRTGQARAALLPDLSAAFSDQNLTRNLAAQGLQFSIPIPGFHFPTFVGPFTTMDARATVTQSVFDFSSIKRFQASKVGVSAARSDVTASTSIVTQMARLKTGESNAERAPHPNRRRERSNNSGVNVGFMAPPPRWTESTGQSHATPDRNARESI